jgi:hypothetical protein
MPCSKVKDPPGSTAYLRTRCPCDPWNTLMPDRRGALTFGSRTAPRWKQKKSRCRGRRGSPHRVSADHLPARTASAANQPSSASLLCGVNPRLRQPVKRQGAGSAGEQPGEIRGRPAGCCRLPLASVRISVRYRDRAAPRYLKVTEFVRPLLRFLPVSSNGRG